MPTWEEIQQGIKDVLQPLGEYANIATLMPNWGKAIQALPYLIQEQSIPPELTPENPSFDERINQTLANLKENLPTDPEEMMNRGLPFMPSVGGVIRPNFRNPEQIKALRRIMAEEQRARGPINKNEFIYTPEKHTEQSLREIYPNLDFENIKKTLGKIEADPIDQILRGSWYHGMSKRARENIGIYGSDPITLMKEKPSLASHLANYLGYKDFDHYYDISKQMAKMSAEVNGLENIGPPSKDAVLQVLFDQAKESNKRFVNQIFPDELKKGFDTGFPISRHDTQSISNKLGEPAGVSLSLNPTVSSKFSADENVFRVLPLYGGPPTQRTVNLMTPEGRKALNDAYDVVANQKISDFIGNYPVETTRNTLTTNPQATFQGILEGNFPGFDRTTGNFNQALSDQLQNQGYRHILYNPQRWNEYEMLALDPKYALPLDYRQTKEYTDPIFKQIIRHGKTSTITPKANQAIENIGDLMSQNASRLGDIYKERSWWDRINEGIKEVLLRDNPNAEEIIRKLKGGL